MSHDEDLLTRLREATDAACVVPADQAMGRSISPTGHTMGAVPILRPATTAQVVACVQRCAEAGRSLIALGGGSNYAGSTRPAGYDEWYLSLERMNQIELIDDEARLAVVGAGVVLQTLQEAASDKNLLFAVDLGGRGSATVGGLIATNAGGERVLRYGMMREQVLGLEVVLADGRVVNLMDRVLKNNAGYDIKQLFVGSEGTLGIVTRAVLRLRPQPRSVQTAIVALHAVESVAVVLNRIESRLGGTLSAFEMMWPEFYDTMCGGDAPKHRPPLATGAPAYVIMEAEGGDEHADSLRFEAMLTDLIEQELLIDAVIAQSGSEREAIWAIRNDIPNLATRWKPRASFDISVPIDSIPGYVSELREKIKNRFTGGNALVFGHVADNNLHIGVSLGEHTLERYDDIAACVYEGISERHGSISAEHGIGLDKRDFLKQHKQAIALSLMADLKTLFDPQNMLNPGKVVEPSRD